MKRLFATSIFVLTLALPGVASAATAKFEVSGWIPYWRSATGTADVLPHLSQLSEINPFGYTVKTDGTLADSANLTQEPWVSFLAAARAKKVRVIPTVMWSDTANIHKILSNAKSRQALEDNIANMVKANGFDGAEIDFEGKRAEDKDYYSTFLKGLYMRMGSKWVMCDIEARTPLGSRYEGTPPADATQYANDYVAINKYCDRVKLMTYDQGTIDLTLNRARSAPYIPLSDPAWVEKVILEASKTIAKNKIMIGVPTYGYEYEVTPLSEYGYRYDLQWAFNPRYATDLANSLGITPTRNGSDEISFIYTPKLQVPPQDLGVSNTSPIPAGLATNSPAAVAQATLPYHVLWWSDAKAIADKVALAKKLGVRGVAVFKMDGGEDPGMWAVLK